MGMQMLVDGGGPLKQGIILPCTSLYFHWLTLRGLLVASVRSYFWSPPLVVAEGRFGTFSLGTMDFLPLEAMIKDLEKPSMNWRCRVVVDVVVVAQHPLALHPATQHDWLLSHHEDVESRAQGAMEEVGEMLDHLAVPIVGKDPGRSMQRDWDWLNGSRHGCSPRSSRDRSESGIMMLLKGWRIPPISRAS
jgi:hypothetical protein